MEDQTEPTVEPQEEVKEAKETRVKKSEVVPGEVKESGSPFPPVPASIDPPKQQEEYTEAYPPGKSETAHGRPYLARYCNGLGLDIGFGFDAIVPWALTMDSWHPYTSVGGDKQILRGDAMDLSGFCDEVLDYCASSHCIEDWVYADQVKIITEWRRVLKVGGYLVLNGPDQVKFENHCARTGQGLNLGHKEPDYSLENFKSRVLSQTGNWEIIFEKDDAGPYSWYLAARRI